MAAPMQERAMPAPPANPESKAFYEAAKEGRFLIGRCTDTGRYFWYPRAVSPFTFGAATIEPASGKGVIYSLSTMRRVDPPYTIAYVTLEEGPTMLTNLVDCDPDSVSIGDAVRLVWKPSGDGTPVPCFTAAT